MQRSAYDAYLRCFEARDYDGMLDHFTPQGEVRFGGVTLRGQGAIRDFYRFFHAAIAETIEVKRYIGSDTFVALEAVVRLEAKADLTREMLVEAGYPQLQAIDKGAVVELPQFIHYHLTRGLIDRVVCLLED